jgi:arsenical pump membrane protein
MIHTILSAIAFAVTIILVITSPRVPIMFNLYKWYKDRANNQHTYHSQIDTHHQEQQQQQHESTIEEEHVDTNEEVDIELQTQQQQHDSNDEHNTQDTEVTMNSMIPWYKRYIIYVNLDVGVAPVLVLLVLLCTTTLSFGILKKGIIGNEYLQPYSIVLLFMSLAYVCISLDTTGLFQYVAQLIVTRSKDSGKKLFILFSIFTSILTIVTSNDIVILTVTPILCYTAKHTTNMDPIPFVTTQFFLANVWSITLKIGNPTNVIVAEAYDLSFLNYFLWMAIPAAVAGLSTFGLSYLLFRNRIPDKIELIDDLSREATDTKGHEAHENTSHTMLSQKMAIAKAVLLLLCLVSLATLTNIKHVKTWMICVAFGVLFFAIDVISDIIQIIIQRGSLRNIISTSVTWKVITRMPWKIVPFVFSMFIIVELLSKYGLISLFAKYICKGLSIVIPKQPTDGSFTFMQKLSSISAIVFVVSILSFLMCNVMNNQPMTILFTTLLHDPSFEQLFAQSHKAVNRGAMLSLVVGSNLGANFTLIGALAGLLWIGILRDLGATKGMSSFTFIKYAVTVTPLVILLVSITLIVELTIAG